MVEIFSDLRKYITQKPDESLTHRFETKTMGIPHQAKKQSPRRTSAGRLAPHTPRHTRSSQARHTPRSQTRAATPRRQSAHSLPGLSLSHSHRSLSTQGGSNRSGNRHTHIHGYTHLPGQADQGVCSLFCYLCYCGYCLGLMVLSFCLLLFLCPPSPRVPSHHSSPLSSSSHNPVDSVLSMPSSLPHPICPYPSLDLSPSNLSAFLLSSDSLSLFDPHLNGFPFNLSSSPSSCSSVYVHSSHHSSSSSNPSQHDSIPFTRPFVLVPPSLMPLSCSSLCPSRPSTSHSLPALLLCPPSFPDSPLTSMEHIPLTGGLQRPRTLLRQQSLQQPLINPPTSALGARSAISQSLGQLHPQPGREGGGAGPGGVEGVMATSQREGAATRGTRGTTAGGGASRIRSGGTGSRATRGNPGSWDYMMGQVKNRGLDVKSFL